jgi:hypothetical protein
MLNKSDYLEAHSKFYDFLITEKASCNKYLSYDQYVIPSVFTVSIKEPGYLIFSRGGSII